METRAHHLLIGGFMLLLVGAAFAFFLWVAKVDLDREIVAYDIYFEESVAGLSDSGDVRYNGIRVGKVDDIRIDPDDPSQVLVTVEIDSQVPVQEDSVAVLALQGLTGVAFVQIEGGSAGSPRLKALPGQPRPVIPSRVSPIQEFFVGGPDLINEALRAVASLNDVLREENRAKVASILTNVEEATGSLVGRSEEVAALITDLRGAVTQIRDAAAGVERLSVAARAAVDEDLRPGVSEVREMVASADELLKNLDGMIDDNRGAVATFTNNTLPEISRLIVDARRLAVSLASLAERLEENPGELIFQTGRPEQEIE